MRDFKGRFSSFRAKVREFLFKAFLFLFMGSALVAIVMGLIYKAGNFEARASTPVIVATSTPVVPEPSLYKQIEELAERRTQKAMKDPKNIQKYHDTLFEAEMKSINILTTY